VGHKYTREQLLAEALDVAFSDGFSELTFGRVARRLNVSDRVLVYYFPTKDDLITAIIVAMGAQLQGVLAPAFATPVADHIELVRVAWPVLAAPDADPVFRLFFEANGLAAAGRTPYVSVVPILVGAWVDWAASLLTSPVDDRRAEAEAAIATIDGLLLVRHLCGVEASERAAAVLGVN
jgi:AcrR family transcriptional regulator